MPDRRFPFPKSLYAVEDALRFFVADNPEANALIHALIALGKALGIETLAEGIEEPRQLRQLKREQCDSGQGYLFARPMTAGELVEFIDKTPRVGASQPTS